MCKIRVLFFLGFLAFALLQSSAHAYQITTPIANYSPPVIENHTKAVSVEISSKKKYGYIFQITNNSTKNIVAVRATAFYRKKSTSHLFGGDLIRPMLLPGKQMEIEPPLPGLDEKLPLETFADPSEEPKVVISGVVFDDLTYEGDPLGNVQTAGRWLGYKIQAQRIADLFQKALKDIEHGQVKVLESLRQQVSMLAERAVESDIKRLEQRLSPLTIALIDELKLYTSMGLTSLKQDILLSIALYKTVDSANGMVLQTWLTDTFEFYEKRVKDLSVIF